MPTVLTVLVVDDDAPLRQFLETMLPRFGFFVVTADGGHNAVEAYEGQPVDVVLLDVQMEGMDGVDTLHALQRIAPCVRCCFMSGHTGRYSREQLYEHGGLGFIAKPFTIQDVADVLHQLARVP